MLTDIFAYRYADRPIWTGFAESDRILLVQGFQLVAEQLFPLNNDTPTDSTNKNAWIRLHNDLCRELGVDSLSPLIWGFENSKHSQEWGQRSATQVCKTWLLADFKAGQGVDVFMKQRISFFELAFRFHMQTLVASQHSYVIRRQALKGQSANSTNKLAQLMGDIASREEQVELDLSQVQINIKHTAFNGACDELNERFKRAKIPLNYHNGYIQIETDALVQHQITEPFWNLVKDPKWKNVEIDMMEAVDRREANDRDPGVYALRALESVIKIISDERGWTTRKEKGPSQFIDNLRSTANGTFIEEWEAVAMRNVFSNVRNELSHGPGNGPMPALTQQQTDWTIEAAMSWTKSLIGRL